MNKTTLHWSYLNFKDVPMDLFLYEDLEEVYLKENFITTIPKWLLNVTTLKFIHLAGNNLSALPEEMYLLENLEFLDVSNNQIRQLPKTVGLMGRLQRFNVSGNELTELPAGLILHVDDKTEDKTLCQLNALAVDPSPKPWPITFSFDRTMQSSIFIAWTGKKKNIEKAQQELLKMLGAFSQAAQGTYVPGSMKSLANQCYCKKPLKAFKITPAPLPDDCVKYDEISRPPPALTMVAKSEQSEKSEMELSKEQTISNDSAPNLSAENAENTENIIES